ncbi:hypothetical protein [Legionella sp. WA2024007413]
MGELIGRAALVAQSIDFTEFQIENPEVLDDNELHHERHTIETHDGVQLDTLQINHSSQEELPSQYRTYIINFNCNFKAYEQNIGEMQNNARELKTNVIGFNYRSVSLSNGRASSIRHLITDGIAQVQRLLDQGVPPENITLNGLSIGGAVSTIVAWYFHQLDYKVNLFNDRSFSSTEKLVLSHLEATNKSLFAAVVNPVIKAVAPTLLHWADWEVNAYQAFKEIPAEYKEYMLIRTHKTQRTEETKDDHAIPFNGSLHAALKMLRVIKKERDGYSNWIPYNETVFCGTTSDGKRKS